MVFFKKIKLRVEGNLIAKEMISSEDTIIYLSKMKFRRCEGICVVICKLEDWGQLDIFENYRLNAFYYTLHPDYNYKNPLVTHLAYTINKQL